MSKSLTVFVRHPHAGGDPVIGVVLIEKGLRVRILHIGDIVGKPGRKILQQALPGLRIRESLDLIVVNAENAAGGSGITPAIFKEILRTGVDCVTLGDHIYRRKEIASVLNASEQIN